eukprot:640774-Rhodomonas_salina.1
MAETKTGAAETSSSRVVLAQPGSGNNWQLDNVPQYKHLLDRFVLVKKLSGSDKAILFLAQYKHSKTEDLPDGNVILKLLAPGLGASEVARFKREFNGISEVKKSPASFLLWFAETGNGMLSLQIKHPNIVQYFEIGKTGIDGSEYIAMEAVPGRQADSHSLDFLALSFPSTAHDSPHPSPSPCGNL